MRKRGKNRQPMGPTREQAATTPKKERGVQHRRTGGRREENAEEGQVNLKSVAKGWGPARKTRPPFTEWSKMLQCRGKEKRRAPH